MFLCEGEGEEALLPLESARVVEPFGEDGRGLTSIALCIGDDYQTSRSKLISTMDGDKAEMARV